MLSDNDETIRYRQSKHKAFGWKARSRSSLERKNHEQENFNPNR
jgi:hypothetical protein